MRQIGAVEETKATHCLMQIITLLLNGVSIKAGRGISQAPLTETVEFIASVMSDDIPIKIKSITSALAHHIAQDTGGYAVRVAITFQIRPHLRRGIVGHLLCGLRILRCTVAVDTGIVDIVLMGGTGIGKKPIRLLFINGAYTTEQKNQPFSLRKTTDHFY